MGGNWSTPSSSNPNPPTATMPPPNSTESTLSEPTCDPSPPESQAGTQNPSDQPSEKPPEDQKLGEDGAVPEGAAAQAGDKEGEGEGEAEEEGECGFCVYMKGGGCKDAFIEWEKCIQEGEEKGEDIVNKCVEATAALKTCMQAHADYYGPLLEAEKEAHERALKELEEEKERQDGVEESTNVAEVRKKQD